MKILVSYSAKSLSDFYTLLKIPENADEDKKERVLQTRIAKLGEGKACSRCGGSGHYSYNAMTGTTCFKCKGSGVEPIPKSKFNDDLYKRLQKVVATGELDRYLDNQKEFAKIKKIEQYTKLYLDAWGATGISKEYDWFKASKKIQPDKDISDEVNQPIADHLHKLRDACDKLTGLKFKLGKARSSTERDQISNDILKEIPKIEKMYKEGLELIEKKMKLLPAIKKRWSK